MESSLDSEVFQSCTDNQRDLVDRAFQLLRQNEEVYAKM
jgi:hypothetical protein